MTHIKRIVAGAILILVLNTSCLSASWRQEHSVKGLPTTDGSELTSYAGLVPIRKDLSTDVEAG